MTSLGTNKKDNLWYFVYFKDADKEYEFAITKRNKLICDKRKEIFPGETVRVKFGLAKMKAIVVAVNDSRGNILDNVENIKKSFLKKLSKKLKKRRRSSENINVEVQCNLDIQPRNSYNIELDNFKLQLEKLNLEKIELRKKLILLRKQLIETQQSELPLAHGSNVNENVRIQLRNGNKFVTFGTCNTLIEYRLFKTINWNSVITATRSLLELVFGSDILATHVLEENSDTEDKPILNPEKVADIVDLVCTNYSVNATVVRNCITGKCAFENEMCNKKDGTSESDDESEECDTDWFSQSIAKIKDITM